eukprot:4734578-Pyramimonas_sp.AAC.1
MSARPGAAARLPDSSGPLRSRRHAGNCRRIATQRALRTQTCPSAGRRPATDRRVASTSEL